MNSSIVIALERAITAIEQAAESESRNHEALRSSVEATKRSTEALDRTAELLSARVRADTLLGRFFEGAIRVRAKIDSKEMEVLQKTYGMLNARGIRALLEEYQAQASKKGRGRMLAGTLGDLLVLSKTSERSGELVAKLGSVEALDTLIAKVGVMDDHEAVAMFAMFEKAGSKQEAALIEDYETNTDLVAVAQPNSEPPSEDLLKTQITAMNTEGESS
jgi:hypothetical protein